MIFAIIDLLNSTGMRVGELVNIDIADMDFDVTACLASCTGSVTPEEPAGDGFVTVSKGTIPADQTVAKNAIEANL